MGAFICEKCGCVDNTATSNFWDKWKLVCAICDPSSAPKIQKMNLVAFKRKPPQNKKDFCAKCGMDMHTCGGRHPYLEVKPKPRARRGR